MTLPTHLLAGLIIGKISGDYTAAIFGSLAIDIDHVISYFRHDILFKPKQLFKAMLKGKDPWGDQRNFLHSIFSLVIVSLLFSILNPGFGLVFFIAYCLHLTFDALNENNFYPLFPSKKFSLKGFIEYNSKEEVTFDIVLIIILASLFIF